MARTRKVKTTRKQKKTISAAGNKTGILNRLNFKLTESYTSLILGAIVVLFIGILILTITSVNRSKQTSSTKTTPTAEQNVPSKGTSSTYTVRPGDDLWTISEKVYRDGYRWVNIAQANKLTDPNLIYSGSKLIIPKISPTPQVKTSPTPTSIAQNNSITENTYTVVSGDSLWDIAVRAYGDGFKWTEIAQANNLANPSIIHAGNFFKIPR